MTIHNSLFLFFLFSLGFSCGKLASSSECFQGSKGHLGFWIYKLLHNWCQLQLTKMPFWSHANLPIWKSAVEEPPAVSHSIFLVKISRLLSNRRWRFLQVPAQEREEPGLRCPGPARRCSAEPRWPPPSAKPSFLPVSMWLTYRPHPCIMHGYGLNISKVWRHSA